MDYSTVPKYREPLAAGHEPVVTEALWEGAYQGFEDKQYRSSLLHVLNFINQDLLKDKDTNGDIKISHAHGSSKVEINISDSTFQVIAPFLRINQDTNKIALMRRVAEINFTPLTLAQIFLKDDVLWFECSVDFELCQPNKIYDVIREICTFCDDYDDEFIEKYNAAFYQNPQIKPLSPENQEKVWDHFQEIAEQYKSYLDYFEQKRWLGSIWDITALSMLNISSLPYVHGTLRTELEENLAHLYDNEIEGNYRLDKGKKYLKTLFEDTSKEDFLKNIYEVDILMSLKARSSISTLQQEFEESRERVAQELNDGQHFSACYTMYLLLLRLLCQYNLDLGHKDAITSILKKVSGMDTAEATPILLDVYAKFLDGSIAAEKKKKKGFFASLLS